MKAEIILALLANLHLECGVFEHVWPLLQCKEMEGHHGFGIYIIVQYIEGSNTSIVTHKWVEAIIMHVQVDDEIM